MNVIKLFPTLTTSSILAFSFVLPVSAQVIPDGTTSTTVDVDGTINDGDRAGSNLFHSFQEFSVPDGGRAFFNNAADIVNIFSRVTGSNISSINGLLGANGTANLFLINPAGIIFGENASLNIGGSFYGSSADSILFPEGEFSATDLANPPLITINAPLGLGIRDNPGDIINQSVADGIGLSVNEGESISLIGGNVRIANGGIIFAPGGRVELGGLTEAATVNFNGDGSLIFPEGIARGDVSVTDSSIIAVISLSSGAGGSIGVNANNFELSSGSSFLGGILADSGSIDAQAGNIVIDTTDSVVIDGQGDSDTGIIADISTNSLGNAGNLDITTDSLTVNSASISLDSDGQGNAGNININARDLVLFDNATLSTSILSSASENANAGNINITTGSLNLNNAGFFSDNPVLGNGGNINIDAQDTVSLANFSQFSLTSAAGGFLTVKTTNFELTSGSSLNVGIFPGNGTIDAQTGELVINATGNISLDNGSIFNQIGTDAIGNTGNITLTGQNISLTNGGLIFNTISGRGNTGDISLNATDSINIDGSGLTGILSFVAAEGQGNLGRIQLTADNISFTNGGRINSLVSGLGNSGNIQIITNNLVLDGEDPNNDLLPSAINSQNSGIGDAGNINISTNNLTLNNGSQIGADLSGGQGNAGDINITASQITIRGQSSRSGLASSISSNVQGTSEGNGGNINITSDSLSLEEGGQISASTISEGNAGTININATNNISIDGGNGTIDSTIAANVLSDTKAQGGSVNINTPNLVITNDGGISTFSVGQETAGNISINTNNFLIDNGTINSTNSGQGDAGNISLAASDKFTATNGSLILTNVGNIIGAPTVGRVGNIEITAREISLNNTAQIQAGAFSGATAEGTGTVSLNATESISFTGNNTGYW